MLDCFATRVVLFPCLFTLFLALAVFCGVAPVVGLGMMNGPKDRPSVCVHVASTPFLEMALVSKFWSLCKCKSSTFLILRVLDNDVSQWKRFTWVHKAS